jgi:O-antigen/teichoic acid export membrane protein
MQILSSGLLLGVLMSPMAILAQGQGEPQHQMKSTLLQAAANVVLSSTLLYFYGFFGAVVGTTVATTLGMLVFLRLYGPHVDPHPFRLLLSLVTKPLLVSLALGAGGLALVHAADFPDGRLNLALVLLLCFVGFVGLYALLILGSKYLDKDDWGFVRGVMQRKES